MQDVVALVAAVAVDVGPGRPEHAALALPQPRSYPSSGVFGGDGQRGQRGRGGRRVERSRGNVALPDGAERRLPPEPSTCHSNVQPVSERRTASRTSTGRDGAHGRTLRATTDGSPDRQALGAAPPTANNGRGPWAVCVDSGRPAFVPVRSEENE